MPERITLPFHINHTLFRVYGLLRLEERVLVLEFQRVENVLGLLRGCIRSVEVPYRELDSVELIKAMWGGRLMRLRCFRLQALRKVPRALQGVAELRIRRSDSVLAESFAAQLELELAQDRLAQLDEPARSLPSPENKVHKLQAAWTQLKTLVQ